MDFNDKMMEYQSGNELCKLCLGSPAKLICLSSTRGLKLEIEKILTKYFEFEMNSKSLNYICTKCWTIVENFHKLYLTVESNYSYVDVTVKIETVDNNDQDYMEASVVLDTDYKIQKIECQPAPVTTNNIKKAKQEEDLENETILIDEKDNVGGEKMDEDDDDEHGGGDDDDDDDDDEDYNGNNEVDEDDDDDDGGEGGGNDDDDSDYVEKKADASDEESLVKPKIEITNRTKRERLEKQRKKQLNSSKINEMMIKYCSMFCDLCQLPFNSFDMAKTHHKRVHNNHRGYIRCCEKKFKTWFEIEEHCMWHENPETFKCTECSKTYQTTYRLREHVTLIHTPKDERKFKCDECPKAYLRPYMLANHKKYTHASDEDKKFECKTCSQRFISDAFRRAHIKRTHENGDSRICEVCSKFFKCSKSYELHYAFEHTKTGPKKVQCDLCGNWLKHEESLKDHKRRHMAEEQTCKFCGKVSANKKSLRSHIQKVHNDKGYPCSICEKTFKTNQTLKEHLAMHAGLTDLYSCSYCTRTFRSSANMYAHRKRSHPIEYEQNRATARNCLPILKFNQPSST